MMIHVGLVGFEPTASWSRTRRSTKLSHSPKIFPVCYVARPYFAYFTADGKPIEFPDGFSFNFRYSDLF